MSSSARATRCRGWCLPDGPKMTTDDPTLPTIADVRRAAERIAGHAVRTPLISNPFLDERVGGRVLLKCENLQRTGSFKFRGAYNALAALAARDARPRRRRHVVGQPCPGRGRGGAPVRRARHHRHAGRRAGDRSGCGPSAAAGASSPMTAPARTATRWRRAIIAEHGGTLIHPFNDAAGDRRAGDHRPGDRRRLRRRRGRRPMRC